MSNSKPTWELCHPHVLWCILSSVPQFAQKWPFTESSSPIGRSFGIGPFSLNGRHFKTKKDTWHPPVPKFSHFKGISSSHCWTNLAHFPTHFHALRGNYSGSNQVGRKPHKLCNPNWWHEKDEEDGQYENKRPSTNWKGECMDKLFVSANSPKWIHQFLSHKSSKTIPNFNM